MSQVDINHARALVYQLLSSLFAREIDEKRLKELTSEAAQQFWNQLGSDTQLSPSVDKICSRLNEIQDNEALLELAADYCGIFLVGTKHSASPYASLYLNTEDEPLLFGQQHQQMSEFLHQSKLQVQSHFPEPADHLAVMLAYMAHLCCHSDDSTQLRFLETCINSWLATFTAQLIKCDKNGFYSAVAILTLEWVKQDTLQFEPQMA
ncbi:molecular chaperone TorD [Shewanella morhuae]|uniref:Chaperone protein TorD n=1 Tax=Shewanella morhuae TaxID=365591 RepID=A0A380AAP4_9GAMM|nr:molecular chaperone TorD [Shewanella morhuae]SUI77366.1 Chaperone protein TorD [Shewanella morhuae]